MNLRILYNLASVRFQLIRIEYLLALSETAGGHDLVTELIAVYMDHAPHFLQAAKSSITDENYEGFYYFMEKLQLGSERIGAFRLSKRIGEFLEGEQAMSTNQMHLVHASVSNEYHAMVKELMMINRLMKTTA